MSGLPVLDPYTDNNILLTSWGRGTTSQMSLLIVNTSIGAFIPQDLTTRSKKKKEDRSLNGVFYFTMIENYSIDDENASSWIRRC
eukprot:m.91224 g.91224  ORF g.91224 m.91224 type:complete len:85 (+) comp11926_c1_seq2:176-430(+)